MAERKQNVRTSVLLAPEQYAAVLALARRNDVSAAWVIRYAVQKLLERHGDQGELPLLQRER